MKRSKPLIATKPFKKTKTKETNVHDLPKELITEIFARVASSSITDMFSCKLTCKTFDEYVEDRHVYKYASLDKFELVQWRPLSEEKRAFLNRCKACNNLETLYRKGVLDFFRGQNIESALKCLRRAVESGHTGAFYMTCIILLFSGDDESAEAGMRLLGPELRKNQPLRRNLKAHRKELKEIVRGLWSVNPLFRHRPFKCCTSKDDGHNGLRNPWRDDDEVLECEACNVDTEVRICSDIFPRYSEQV